MLFFLGNDVLAFLGLSRFLGLLHLSGELLQLSQQTLVGEIPSSWYWPAEFLMCLREVGYLCRLVGLASLGDWRGSGLCFESIPSVTE